MLVKLKSCWQTLALACAVVATGVCLQGCFWFGGHDNWNAKHKGFAYETPEHTTQGHAHQQRAYNW